MARAAATRDRVNGLIVGPCKYGENAWQSADLFAVDETDPLAVHRFQAVQGDERSFVNLTDVDCGLQVLTHIIASFTLNFGTVPFTAVLLKHGNACGAAVGNDPLEVTRKAVAGDKRAAFGSIAMTNYPVDADVAAVLMEREDSDPMPARYDGVFAPSINQKAVTLLERKQGKCRMMINPALGQLGPDSLDATPRRRAVRGGYLKQSNYTHVLDLSKSKTYGYEVTDQQAQDLVLGWAVGSVSNSNTIALTRDGMLIGLGAGQQDRIGAAELALKRAHDAGHSTERPTVLYDGQKNPRLGYFVKGASGYSDSFCPSPDVAETLGYAGVGAFFTSSGSIRDDETIYMCGWNRMSLLMQPDAQVRGFAKH